MRFIQNACRIERTGFWIAMIPLESSPRMDAATIGRQPAAPVAHPGAGEGPINIGNPHEITIKDFAEEITKLTGTNQKII